MRSLRAIGHSACILLLTTIAVWADEDAPTLQWNDGPYLVYIQSYRGLDSEKKAKELARELKHDHELPAYVYEDKRQPRIPTFAVLVGDAKTPREAEKLQKRVVGLKIKSLGTRP